MRHHAERNNGGPKRVDKIGAYICIFVFVSLVMDHINQHSDTMLKQSLNGVVYGHAACLPYM